MKESELIKKLLLLLQQETITIKNNTLHIGKQKLAIPKNKGNNTTSTKPIQLR
jgi:hypothetical protein